MTGLSEYNTESSIDYSATNVEDIDELAESVKSKLLDADIKSINQISDIGLEGLQNISGIGPKTAEKIWDVVKRYLDEEDEDE